MSFWFSGGGYALEALLLGRKRVIEGSGSRSIAIIPDVVISEEHNDEVTVTRHPVDMGAQIADHAFKNPAVLTCSFGWSDSSTLMNSISLRSLTDSISSGAWKDSLSSLKDSITSGSFLKGVSSTKEVYERLLEIMEARELLSVSTGKRAYSNMLITRLQTSSTAETENALVCEITFEEVNLVTISETVLKSGVQAYPEVTASANNRGLVNGTAATSRPKAAGE